MEPGVMEPGVMEPGVLESLVSWNRVSMATMGAFKHHGRRIAPESD